MNTIPSRLRHPAGPKAIAAGLCFLAAAAVSGAVCAQPIDAAHEPRTWLQLHGTAGTWRMQTRGPGFLLSDGGSSIQTESELGLPRSKTVPGLAFGRRIGQRWRFEFEYSSAHRRGAAVLGRDLAVDGVVFSSGTLLESDIGLSTLSFNGGWSFLMSETTELGALFGGLWVSSSRNFQGQGQRPDLFPPGVSTPVSSSSSSELAPFALLGFYGQRTLADDWRLSGRFAFSKNSNYQLTLGAQWAANRHLALGAGYRITRYKADELFGFIACCSYLVLDARIHGPMLSATLAF